MRDLIFISMENWDDHWRRNQFVCAELARRHPQMKILFLGVARNVLRHAARFDLAPLLTSPVQSVPGFPNITTTRALRIGLERYDWGLRLNESIARRHLRALSQKLGLRDPILWLNPHSAVNLAGTLGESAVIYDITDDWISRDQPQWLADQVRQQDARLCRKADAVIVCSQRLLEMKQPLAPGKLHLIPNGVDAPHYQPVISGAGPLPADATWPKPVFGYTGTIHTDRLDVDLLQSVAQHLDHGSLVFIGPNHLPPQVTKRLTDTGKIFFHAPVPYDLLPQYMRAFNVCITPHRISPFVESLQPIKLWEYLAAGKPIVATDVAGFRDFPHLVRLARGPDEFLLQLAAAPAEGNSLAAQRQAVAKDQSWQSRVDAIEQVFAEVSAVPIP